MILFHNNVELLWKFARVGALSLFCLAAGVQPSLAEPPDIKIGTPGADNGLSIGTEPESGDVYIRSAAPPPDPQSAYGKDNIMVFPEIYWHPRPPQDFPRPSPNWRTHDSNGPGRGSGYAPGPGHHSGRAGGSIGAPSVPPVHSPHPPVVVEPRSPKVQNQFQKNSGQNKSH